MCIRLIEFISILVKSYYNTEPCVEYKCKHGTIKKARTDAGFDVPVAEDVILEPKVPTIINCSLALGIPAGYWGLFKERSSIAQSGVFLMGGVMDAGYNAYLRAIAVNMGTLPFKLKCGERIGQVVVCPLANLKFKYIDDCCEFTNNYRGDKGFGSTGK